MNYRPTIGTRVVCRNVYTDGKPRLGTVVGCGRDPKTIRVLIDGHKSSYSWSRDFWEQAFNPEEILEATLQAFALDKTKRPI